MKFCPDCRHNKELSEFHRHKHTCGKYISICYRPICKLCWNLKQHNKRIVARKDPQKRSWECLQNRTGFFLRQHKIIHSPKNAIGCTFNFFIDYISKLLHSNQLKWNDYGVLWELDHKIPFIVYEQYEINFKILTNIQNVQPLAENIHRKKMYSYTLTDLNSLKETLVHLDK